MRVQQVGARLLRVFNTKCAHVTFETLFCGTVTTQEPLLPARALGQRGITSAAKPPADSLKGKDRSRQLPALVRYGRDLTEEARRDLLDPVIGRQEVIQRTMQILLRRAKHNPLLIGEAGVGKTAIVEGIAQLMAAPNPPTGLSGKRLVALDVGAVVAGSTYRGEFEERLQSLLHDCEAAQGRVVLFIDEIHVLVGAGNVEGGLDFANMLKPALARSQLQVIGATTIDEYRQHIETDPALSRRFQPVLVDEPSPEECLQLLQGLAPRYEAFHGVSFPHITLATAVAAAQRYAPERRLPDSAIDLLDESAAKVRLATASYLQHSGRDSNPDTKPQHSRDDFSRNIDPVAAASSSTAQQHQQQQQPALSVQELNFWEEWQQEPAAVGAHTSSSTLQGNISPNHQAGADSARQTAAGQHPLGQPLVTGQAAEGVTGERVGGRVRGSAGAQSWSDWITAKGWRGEAEVHRQQLLEWFGAHPHNPLKGSAGHRQTTQERMKRHQQLFSRPDATRSAQPLTPSSAPAAAAPAAAMPSPTPAPLPAVVPSTAHTVTAAAAAAEGRPRSEITAQHVPLHHFQKTQQQQQQRVDTTGLLGLGGCAPLDYTAKPCPHCGSVVLPTNSPDPVRLRCHSCGFKFLNVAPEKLQLGTTVLMDRQQQQPPVRGSLGAQQAGRGLEKLTQHHASLSQTPADVVAGAAAAAAAPTAASHEAKTVTRTAVAVQQQEQQQQYMDASAQQRWDWQQRQQQMHRQRQQQGQPMQAKGEQRQQQHQPHPLLAAADPARPASASAPMPTRSPTAPDDVAPDREAAKAGQLTVSPADILQVVSEATGIPQHLLVGLPPTAAAPGPANTSGGSGAAMAARQVAASQVADIQAALSAAVKGQDAATAAVIAALRASRLGLSPHASSARATARSGRPALSLLLQGPPGVGKTTMAHTLAEALLPGESQGLLTFSCGELSERHSISRLVGAPPGYVGYGKGGLLTEAIRRRPYSCVLFDDVERAHPDVVGLLLQAVEDGYLMDSLGHTINLRSTSFVFTANTNQPAITALVPDDRQKHETAAAQAQAAGVHVLQAPGRQQQQQQGFRQGDSCLAPTEARAFHSTTSHNKLLLQDTAMCRDSHYHWQGPRPTGTVCDGTDRRSCDGCHIQRHHNHVRSFHVGGCGSEGAELESDEQDTTLTAAAAAAAAAAATSTGSLDPPAARTSPNHSSPPSTGGTRGALMEELGARVDDVIHFQPLNPSSMVEVVHQRLQQAMDQALQQGVLLQVDAQAVQWLARAGCSARQGARPLNQLIRRQVLSPLAAAVMEALADQDQAHSGPAATAGVWAVARLSLHAPVGDAPHVPRLQLHKQ